MQDYYEFLRELRAGLHGIGEEIHAERARGRLRPSQMPKFRNKNFMTDEKVGYRLCAGEPGAGLCIVEISHGVFIDKRLIGLTVFHIDQPERDDDASGCFETIAEAAGRLRTLNGEEA
jgi:hypothetical protein